jgi:hypothetical protein
MNYLITFASSILLSMSALANETHYEPRDCNFTNLEIQTGLANMLAPALAQHGVKVVANSLTVEDSTVDPYSIYTIKFGIAKIVTFNIDSGEQLSLENLTGWGTVDPELTHPAMFIEQGQLRSFSDLGVLQSTKCLASFPFGAIGMMLKNTASHKSLPTLTEKVRRELTPESGNLVFLTKDL